MNWVLYYLPYPYKVFWQNGKPVALLFGENWPFLGTFQFGMESGVAWNGVIFCKNGKPIALLLGKNWLFWGTFHFGMESVVAWLWFIFCKNGQRYFMAEHFYFEGTWYFVMLKVRTEEKSWYGWNVWIFLYDWKFIEWCLEKMKKLRNTKINSILIIP